MKRKTGKHLLLLLFLLPLLILLQNFIQQRSQASLLKPDTCFTESFREQALSSALYAELEERVHSDGEFADLLTTTMLNGKFFPKYLSGNRKAYLRFKPKAYYDLRSCYLAVWKDLENFPIPIRNDREIWQEIFYENTFGAARSYGGSGADPWIHGRYRIRRRRNVRKISGSSSSGNLHKSTGKRGTECKPLLCLTGNGEKSKKIHLLITNFLKYML